MSGKVNSASSGRIHFPIEGRSACVLLLRIMALGAVAPVVVLSAVFLTIDIGIEPAMAKGLMTGIFIFLLAEFIVIRRLVVPRFMDYARYRIYENKVDFYPLTPTGLGVATTPESVPLNKFEGIAVRSEMKHRPGTRVVLMHARPGRSVVVRQFPAAGEAQAFAQELAAALKLNVVSPEPAKRKARL